MTERRPTTLSGSIEFNVDKLVAAIVAAVVDAMAPTDDRGNRFLPPDQMPPRGTVRFGDYTGEGRHAES